jgi:hypothetical protein
MPGDWIRVVKTKSVWGGRRNGAGRPPAERDPAALRVAYFQWLTIDEQDTIDELTPDERAEVMLWAARHKQRGRRPWANG